VYATSLNPVDRFTRAGYLQGMVDFVLPFTPGLDLAGVVEAVGGGVSTVAVGDAVYGYSNMMRQGAYAEYALVGAGEIAPKPASVDFVTAAAVPMTAITAWQGLFDVGGSLAVQFARAKGAHVLATAGSDKQALLRELGVAQAIDYTTTRFETVVHDVDVVFDTVGGELIERSLAVLKPGGIYVSPAAQLDAEAGKAQGVRALGMMSQANPAQFREIAALIDAGKVKPVVSSVLPLAEAHKAHEQLEAGHTRGKIVLRVVEA
jgi:NADPH:quinone reductase-like Zn-dependent oxidoreductase